MSRKNSHTTSDALQWNDALNLIHRLYRDGNYRLSLLIGCGCFFGLRISDLRTLRWNMLLDGEKFELNEKKTGKYRVVKINQDFQKHIRECYDALRITDPSEYCFLSTKKVVFSTQRINVLLKEIKQRYNLKIENFSTHTLRKTFGRKVVEMAGENAEVALIKLMELFNHSSLAITKRYLGLRQEELLETYDLLNF
jgi:integrase